MTAPPFFVGLDAGGTQTRWAVASLDRVVHAQGAVAGFSGLMMHSDSGRAELAQTLRALADAVAQSLPSGGAVAGVTAGITGLAAAQEGALCALIGEAFALPAQAVVTLSDIELACHAAFAPGAGYVLYAGTGSVAAFVDASGQLQRAGGRGPIIDDAGGGFWIAREALRQVWRLEDMQPGAWRRSALAGALFEAMGGAGWGVTRQWVYGATRGEMGTLALAVARAASGVAPDPAALAILVQAGHELARLGQALLTRYGDRPIALAGRVFELDPIIETTLRDALPRGIPVQRAPLHAHQTAARLAAERFTP